MNRIQQATDAAENALMAFVHEAFSVWVLAQVGVILVAAAIAMVVAMLVRRRVDLAAHTTGWPALLQLMMRQFIANLSVFIFALLVVIARGVASEISLPNASNLLDIADSLAFAWIIIALAGGPISNRFVYRVVTVFAWLLAAGYIVGWRHTIRTALDSYAITIGGLRISPLLAIKTTVLLLLTLWAANVVSDFLEKRVRSITDLTPSIQVLISKLIRLLLITFAILAVLSSVGIDFSALAIFSGAVGVGLGFGLQKVVSNLVSGIMLLADKSIKPGDIITVDDHFGWVTNMGARYTSVDTQDGREILVPNEDFITQRVVNWSYSNNRIRLSARFGASYASDPHHVIKIAVATAKVVPRVLADPAPACYFEAFGDSSLNFFLVYWIGDPDNGIINIRSTMMLALWDAFRREKIEIPFPQRDINPRGPFRVVLEREGGDGSPP